MVIMTIIAGAWSDRLGYLKLLRLSQMLVAIGGIVTAILALTGSLDIFFIVSLSVFVGIGEAITIPPRMSYVHHLVPKKDLSAAIALNSTTYNVTRFFGPALFGILFQIVNVPIIIAIAAWMFSVFYIIIIITLSLLPPTGGAFTFTPCSIIGGINSMYA